MGLEYYSMPIMVHKNIPVWIIMLRNILIMVCIYIQTIIRIIERKRHL